MTRATVILTAVIFGLSSPALAGKGGGAGGGTGGGTGGGGGGQNTGNHAPTSSPNAATKTNSKVFLSIRKSGGNSGASGRSY